MAAAVALAEKNAPPPAPEPPRVRRFCRPDLDEHGGWVMQRLLKGYPHIVERNAAGWLTGLIYNNECLFLYQHNAVGLAQVDRAHTLAPTPLIRERFVWARSPEFVEEASYMYLEFERWGRSLGADTILVCEGMTDVPPELITKRLGDRRIFAREQRFVKIPPKG